MLGKMRQKSIAWVKDIVLIETKLTLLAGFYSKIVKITY